jgi:WD40 repeat protein
MCYLNVRRFSVLVISIFLAIIGSSTNHLAALHGANLGLTTSIESNVATPTTCSLQIDRQQPMKLVGVKGNPNLVFSPDSHFLGATDQSGGSGLILLNLMTGKRENIQPGAWLGKISFSPDGKFVAVDHVGPSAFLINLENKSLIELKGIKRRMKDIQFSPDSRFVATVSLDNTARIWSLDGVAKVEIKGRPRSEFGSASDRDPQMSQISWNSQGQMLVVAFGREGEQFIIWNSANGELIKLDKQREWSHVQFTPDENKIVAVSPDRISFFNLKGVEVSSLPGQYQHMRSLSFSPDGQTFVTTSSEEKEDKVARLWSIDGELLATLKGHKEEVVETLISKDGRCIFTSSYDNTIRLWDTSGKMLDQIPGGYPIALSPDNRYLATVDEDSTILIWKIIDSAIVGSTSGDLGRWEHDRILVGRSTSIPNRVPSAEK